MVIITPVRKGSSHIGNVYIRNIDSRADCGLQKPERTQYDIKGVLITDTWEHSTDHNLRKNNDYDSTIAEFSYSTKNGRVVLAAFRENTDYIS